MIETIIFRSIFPDELCKQVNEFLKKEQENNAFWELKDTHYVLDTGTYSCQLYFDRHQDSAFFGEKAEYAEEDHEEDEVYGDY